MSALRADMRWCTAEPIYKFSFVPSRSVYKSHFMSYSITGWLCGDPVTASTSCTLHPSGKMCSLAFIVEISLGDITEVFVQCVVQGLPLQGVPSSSKFFRIDCQKTHFVVEISNFDVKQHTNAISHELASLTPLVPLLLYHIRMHRTTTH